MEYCAYCGNPVEKVSQSPCAKCGKPTNGAPPPVATGGSNTAIIAVVVVFGGLIVIAIIGVLAAIAIPNFLTAKQRAMQKRTIADIRTLAVAAESYATDNNEYPKSVDALAPKYIATIPRLDGWGHAIEYECLPDETGKCTGYVIGSPAKDGRFESGSLRDALAEKRGATSNFDCDIIYSNGSFIEYPEGVQH